MNNKGAGSGPNVYSIEQIESEISEIDLAIMPSSSTMPANELYLMQQMGYTPLQVVYGNVVYSMGMGGVLRSLRGALTRGELPQFTRMNNDARVIARDRMLKAATSLGAAMVAGVTIDVKELADLLEVTATGTAFKKTVANEYVSTNGLQIAVGT